MKVRTYADAELLRTGCSHMLELHPSWRSLLFRFSFPTASAVFVFVLMGAVALAQTSAPVPSHPIDSSTSPSPKLADAPTSAVRQDAAPSRSPVSMGPAPKLVIGSGDELDIGVFGVPDLAQKVRVNSDGDISL